MDLFEIFNSGGYHRDMKILKILASNSSRFRFFDIFKNGQIRLRVRRPTFIMLTGARPMSICHF